MDPTPETHLPISVVIVARDEERDLAVALSSVPFACEVVVVVDPATTDRTREVARSFDLPARPVNLFERRWEGHVAQKNFALEQATADWVLALDADERVSPELYRTLHALFARGPAASGYRVNRRNFYLGRWMVGGGWYPDRKLRLFRREQGRWVGTDPHDRLEVDGKVENLQGGLEHRSYRNLAEHLEKMDQFTGIAAGEKKKRSVRHPLLRMLIHPPARFLKMYVLRRGYRDGVPGMIAAGMGALYAFLKYAKLWELNRTPGDSPRENEP